MRFNRVRVALAMVTGLLLVAAHPAAAQTGAIRGSVIDQGTGQPIANVLVSVVGTNVTARTDQDGLYELSVPVGNVTIRAAMIGYSAEVRTVTVVAGAPVAADFALPQAVISLDAMVVTATGEQRAVEVPNVITTVDAVTAAEQFSPIDFAALVQGRAQGVQIINSGGTAGTGTKVRIRGSSSLNLSNEPLLVVDGVRVDNRSADFPPFLEGTGGVGGQAPSRLNDFNPDEIESIEIVKGPSAAALYGTEAANGVIVVKTRRGRVGDPVWNLYGEAGVVEETTAWPVAYTGLDADGNPCRNYDIGAGTCSQSELQSFSVLRDKATTPFRNGFRGQFGANVSGGSSALQYFLSGEYESENGVLGLTGAKADSLTEEYGDLPEYVRHPNRLQRISLRANLNAALSDELMLNVSTGYVDGRTRLPQNDNNINGLVTNGLMGRSDSTVNGGWWVFPAEDIFFINTEQNIQRFTQALSSSWMPTTWLDFRGVVGIDFTAADDIVFQAIGTGPDFLNYRSEGLRNSHKTSTWQYTFDFGGTARFDLGDRVTSRTSVGVQYFRNYRQQVGTLGQKLPPGAGSNQSAADQFITESYIETRTVGTFVEQQFGLDNRLYLTLGLRGDDNSAFGKDFDYTVYPKAGLSWLAFSGGLGIIDDLRLRGAWGMSGVAPNTNDARLFFGGIILAEEGTDKTGVAIQNAGNTELKPETSQEFETGFEVGMLNGRMGLDFTFYHRTTKDALINRELAPSLGLTDSRYENLGKTRNYGFEAGLNGTPVRNSWLVWDLSLTGSTNTNKIVELGEGVEPIIFDVQAHKEDYPLGAYWEEPYEWEDANGDGYISADEVVVGDTAVYLGYPRPRYEAALFNSIQIGSWLRISGLFDYRGGHKLYNNTEQFRCRNVRCQALNDPATPLDDQARAVAAGIATTKSYAGYIEDAWFIKLRELAFTFFLPDRMARSIGADRATLTLAGRNLFTITDFSGIDPEVQWNQAGNFGSAAFFSQPTVRYWTARLQLTF